MYRFSACYLVSTIYGGTQGKLGAAYLLPLEEGYPENAHGNSLHAGGHDGGHDGGSGGGGGGGGDM